MSDGRRLRTAILLLAPAAVVAAGLAGCTSSSTSHKASASLSASKGNSFSASKLREALLTRVNGVGATSPAASGDYSSMSAQAAGKQPAGVPKRCAQATQTGLDSAVLAGATAASVSFKVGGNDVSELLVAAPGTSAASALAGRLPASCAHYKETAAGKSVTYSATESPLTGIGKQAKVLSVSPAVGGSDVRWSLVYRGTGFVGAVTVVGPDASQAAVRELGQQAYAYAIRSLS
jgi:hypothetical protein